LCKHPILEKLDNNLAINELGLPKSIGPLQKLLRNNPSDSDIRFILSLLSISRALPGKHRKPNLEDVTNRPSEDVFKYIETISKDIPFVMSKMGIHNISDDFK
jgi:hypothetical protein